PVQWVLRHDRGRSYAGTVGGGPLRPGDPVLVLPGGQLTTVRAVTTYDGSLEEAAVGMSVSVDLEDDIDVSRGDLIASAEEPPLVTSELEATVCWFGTRPLRAGDRLRVKHTTRVAPARVETVLSRFDVNHLALVEADGLFDNEIGVVRLVTGIPLAVDPYRTNRVTGSFVLVDEVTNATLAACMVGAPPLAETPIHLVR
ncbi:MAG: elongation factor 1-alpha C-terminal domain-related protein, partial [Acidimicrobiales bacterium]